MLRAKALTQALQLCVGDGITNAMLVNDEGNVLAAADLTEHETVAAVLASVYNEYKAAEKCVDSGSSTLQSMLFDCENARVACQELTGQEESKVLIAVIGCKTTELGIIWNKLALIRHNLQPLEEVLANKVPA